MALPVDIVVPHQSSRSWFFRRFTLPSLELQNPSRIIVIEDGPGGAAGKRNAGIEKATSKYVFLCDDDLIIGKGHLEASIAALEKASPEYAYTYSDWIQVPLPGCMHPPLTTAQYVVVPAFENLALYDRGGIDMPVLRKDAFVPFDTTLRMFDTWDWALSMKKAGHLGLKIEGHNYISFMFDVGISTGTSTEESARARTYIQRKHGIIS